MEFLPMTKPFTKSAAGYATDLLSVNPHAPVNIATVPGIARAAAYLEFLSQKVVIAEEVGVEAHSDDVNPILKPHQAAIVRWAVKGGQRAIFAAFGLGKSVMQLETVRLCLKRISGGRGLIVIPLGVRQEFIRDAELLGIRGVRFVRTSAEVAGPGIYLTNYESVRDGKIDPSLFHATSLDEASCLRGMGGTKTFREFMRLFERVRYRFVATATPSPNDYIELLAYAAYLGVMDIGQAKTRFFKRNSEKADTLTIHPHKEREFWLWVSSWAVFLQSPADLGFDATGYDLPELDVRWHEIPTNHESAGMERWGQGKLIKSTAAGVVDAAREKRESLGARVEKMMALRAEDPAAHRILWHDLEDERRAIEAAIPGVSSVFGSQDLDEREARIIAFSDGESQELAAKPVIAGSGCNFQRHCSWAIFLGIGFKFNDLIQAIHRLQRFMQTNTVRIDLIYTEAERDVRRILEGKWAKHKELTEKMTEIIREYGLGASVLEMELARSIGVERVEVSGKTFRLINNDCVLETQKMADDSAGLILTSIPFSTQYEYTPSYNDSNAHFWQQMDFLTVELLRVLQPGRVCAIHVKDRIVPGGMTGLGFQSVYPFHCDALAHFTRHGFAYLGMKTIVTDVVRENNQTYRLGWSEQCKDGSRMGVGMPEYLLLFRKPPTDTSNGYADLPVEKDKAFYTRSRWQIDAHGFTRSSGNRHLQPEELENLDHGQIFRMFRDHSLTQVYDFENHVKIGERLEGDGRLPVTFMLLQPQSWSSEVWTDITRMLTLNGAQSAKGREMHLCLARGSMVLTKERGYVPIQDVQVGEHTLTHMGRWRKVLIVRETGNQPVVTLKAQGVPGLTLTPDHKLWARKSDFKRQREYAGRVEPKWIEAQEMSEGYVNQKLPEEEAHSGDETLWWAVGRWLADGHIDGRGGAIISVGPSKWGDFCNKIGRFGGNDPHVGTALQILLRDKGRELRTILERCGWGAADKKLPAEAFTLRTNLAAALLDGYLSGDGSFSESRQRWTASSISRTLLLGVAMLAQRVHGAISSIHPGHDAGEHVIEGRLVNAQQEWCLSFDLPSGSRKQPFVQEDGAWKRVREIQDAGTAETWCLKVEEDESFTAEGCIVKNCPMQFDLADRVITQFSNPGDVVFDPFSGLGTVASRAILLGRQGLGTELNARYFADSVFYCRAAEEKITTPSLFDLNEDEETDRSADLTDETSAATSESLAVAA
jgi:DNA modification methylase